MRVRLILMLIIGVALAVPSLVSAHPIAQEATPIPSLPTPVPTAEGATPPEGDVIQETLEAEIIAAEAPHPCPQNEDPLASPGTATDSCQRVEVLFTSGSLKGKKQIIDEGKVPVASKSTTSYKRGDKVLVDYVHGGSQPPSFFITDFIRTNQLYILALIFAALAIGFGGWRGFTSLIGLVISFVILIFFMLPRILAGDDPILISIASAFVIMLVTLYLSHGFNRKTTAALCGTAVSLVITGLLAWVSVEFIRLSGFGSDEASYVQIARGGTINLQGLLLAGIIIGALGVLDDVTIGQSAAVFEMHNIAPDLPWQRLFGHAINIGKDHIAATVNTLVLAYAGASLPLLILFIGSDTPWDRILNQEVVAEEIVRTLVGSIGLIASVPITTWLASLIATRTPAVPVDPDSPAVHAHHH